LAKSSHNYKKPAIIAGASVAALLAFGGVAYASAAATKAKYPVVSEQVQKYYDENVTGKATAVPTRTPAKKVVAIGDSYSAGTGASSPSLGWVSIMSRTRDWNVTNLARGGTGYVSSVQVNAQNACGLDYCPSYPEMIADAVKISPQVVVVAGGRNDAKVQPSDEAAAIHDFYSQLHAALPQATIVALNPWWDDAGAPASLELMKAAVADAAAAAGGKFVDSGQPLDGKPELLTTDSVHPNDKGHAALAKATSTVFTTAGL